MRQSELSAFLALLPWGDDFRIAIIGIGNELNGDDAAGVLAARSVSRWLARQGPFMSGAAPTAVGGAAQFHPRLLVIDAGPSPESFAGPLRRFAPALVILLDAAELGEPPGAVRVFHWQEAHGMSASTHGMPPTLLATYLVSELGCEVALVGIQPRHLDFDRPPSLEARRAVRRVLRALQQEIAKHL